MQFGDVVLVRFPFTSQTAVKQRPAVVISSDRYHQERPDVVLMAVTSQLRPSSQAGDAWIEDWAEAGLLKPSAIKPVIATLERGLVIRRLGALSTADQANLRSAVANILG